MEEDDPFKLYYEIATGQRDMQNVPKDEPSPLPWEENKPKDIKTDAKTIRTSINAFIKALNCLVGRVFNRERKKGTRLDLIVTLVLGGLSFTMANVYYMITKNLGQKMSATEYEATFMGMYRSAMRDIGKDEKQI